jgi:hypothetical protein
MIMALRKKCVRTLHDRLKIIHEVEKNPGEKRVEIAKRVGLPASTLNSIFAKKNDIREQIQKCGNAYKKIKTGKESTFAELETVLFTWYQHSVTDTDREHILGLEKSYFQLRQNSAKKQNIMYDFLVKKSGFSGLIVSPYSFVFSTPLKNDRSRFHSTYAVVQDGTRKMNRHC